MRLLASAAWLWGAGAARRGYGCLCFSSPPERHATTPPTSSFLSGQDHSSRVTLGGRSPLYGPQFPHLENGYSNGSTTQM